MPVGTTQFSYDAGDRATITDPLGKVTMRFTDPGGRLIIVTSPMGRRTRYEWDPLNRLTKIIDPLGGTTQFTYDPNGNLTGVRDARNNLTQYAPDSMDRALTRTDALGNQSRVLAYDQNGNPTQVRDRKSQVTQTTYDPLNRPKVITWADSSTTTLTWDAGDRVTQLVDSISGTITRAWDDLNRLQYEIGAEGRVDYTYDNAGRRQTMTVLGQPSVTYSWDNADRLQSLTQGSAVALLGYDNANRRTSVTFPNGVVATYSYNARDLTGITFTKGGTTLGLLTYATDAGGRRILVGGTWARTNLPAALTSATYDANSQQITFGGQTLTYDLNGNLTNDGTATYTWDARDRLSAASAGTATFQYDPLGRRTRKAISGQTTRFHYNGVNPAQELDANGAALANLLTGLGIDEYFTRTDSAGTRTLLGDALASTLALADDTGAVQSTYTYEPFGAATATGQSNTNSYQYTARENDGTGLHYYRARYYSPARQRFISEDPIGFAGGHVNLYSYARNAPSNFVDPNGLRALGCLANNDIVPNPLDLSGRKPTIMVSLQGSTEAIPGDPTCRQNCLNEAWSKFGSELMVHGLGTFACGIVAGIIAAIPGGGIPGAVVGAVCAIAGLWLLVEDTWEYLRETNNCAAKCDVRPTPIPAAAVLRR